MEITLDFKVISKDGLPKESGEYFVVNTYSDGTAKVFTCSYSERHKAFNASDRLSTAEFAIKDIVAYCKMPQARFDELINTEVI